MYRLIGRTGPSGTRDAGRSEPEAAFGGKGGGMNDYREFITVGTYDGSSIEGTAQFYSSGRLSEMFNDSMTRFLVMDDVTDDAGREAEQIFLNKDLVMWVAPKELRHTTQADFPAATDYVEVSIHLMNEAVINGKVNLQVFGNIGDMLKYTSAAPFIVLINANDTKGAVHHTLFVNKSFIVKIASSRR
jgi:hypothetical protein